MLMTNAAAGLATEPDAMLVTRAAIRAGRAEFVAQTGRRHRSRELRGAPSWVLEVVSRSSIEKDKKLLRDAYHRGGVEEYWLIDALGEAIDFQTLVAQEQSFVAQSIEDNGIASPLFGRRFTLCRQEDEQGFWQYTLHARAL
jgi:Uma2 family endonuclease